MSEREAPTTSTNTVLEEQKNDTQTGEEAQTVRLKLKKPKKKKVGWTSETVDNEHMDKKKSKCCCIYEKPKIFGESSEDEDDDEDECDHCFGHVEKRNNNNPSAPPPAPPVS